MDAPPGAEAGSRRREESMTTCLTPCSGGGSRSPRRPAHATTGDRCPTTRVSACALTPAGTGTTRPDEAPAPDDDFTYADVTGGVHASDRCCRVGRRSGQEVNVSDLCATAGHRRSPGPRRRSTSRWSSWGQEELTGFLGATDIAAMLADLATAGGGVDVTLGRHRDRYA
jgi:hypothetical protein